MEKRSPMTSDDVREKCIEMINWLLNQEFERPIHFSAIAIDGLTLTDSSETVTGEVQPPVATSGPFLLHLLPVHVLLVDPKGKVAHGVIDSIGVISCRVLS
jgi:hypothetical protein